MTRKVQMKDRMKSVALGNRRKKLLNFEIFKLEGVDKIKYDIGVLEGRIKATEYDIANNYSSEFFKDKLRILNKNLLDLREQLKNIEVKNESSNL